MDDLGLRVIQNNIDLPDVDGATVLPHPDGRAWLKACSECAFRKHDPQNLGDHYQRSLRSFDGHAYFYCIHRHEDDGCDRICASYAAINGL